MRRPVDLSLPLSIEEARRVLGALNAYVESWRSHYEEDAGRTHTEDEWEEVRTETGHLIWRLEELALLPGQTPEHDPNAVPPPEENDGDDDGGAGVREPRRPLPPSPMTAERGG